MIKFKLQYCLLLSYIHCYFIINNTVPTTTEGHWTLEGIKRNEQNESTIEQSYPSTFASEDIATVQPHRRTQNEATNGRTSKRTENIPIRYWDRGEESFKILSVPVYRSDSIGDLAKRAAQQTNGSIPPEISGLFLEGVELYNSKAFKYFINSARNGGVLTLGYQARSG